MEYHRGNAWSQIAHEYVRAQLRVLISAIRLDIHFGREKSLVDFAETAKPQWLYGVDWLAAAAQAKPDEIPPLAFYDILFKLGDKWTLSVYEVYCSVWRQQGKSKSNDFILDVWYEGVLHFIRDELPSLFAYAMLWALPKMKDAILGAAVMPAGVRYGESVQIRVTLASCRKSEQLQGITRTVDSLVEHWNQNTITSERSEVRKNEPNPDLGLTLPMAIPLEPVTQKAIRTPIPESIASSPQATTVTVTKDMESELLSIPTRTVSACPRPASEVGGRGALVLPQATRAPRPITPVRGSVWRPPSPPPIPDLEETRLIGAMKKAEALLDEHESVRTPFPAALADARVVLGDYHKLKLRECTLRLELYRAKGERKEPIKAQLAEIEKVADQWNAAKDEARGRLKEYIAANDKPAQASRATQAPPAPIAPAKPSNAIHEAVLQIAKNHGKLEEWSAPEVPIDFVLLCKELDGMKIPVPEEWQGSWAVNRERNDDKVKARLRQAFKKKGK